MNFVIVNNVLNIMDAVSTAYLLGVRGVPVSFELNPLMRWMIMSYGFVWFIILKFIVVFLALYAFNKYMTKTIPDKKSLGLPAVKWYKVGMGVACAFFSVCVINNLGGILL